MARQEDACWQCGTRWASEQRQRTPLHVVPSSSDADRWVDEGGSFEAEKAAAAGSR
jgi:hypothetical protein